MILYPKKNLRKNLNNLEKVNCLIFFVGQVIFQNIVKTMNQKIIQKTRSGKYRYYAVRCPYRYMSMADKNGYVMEHRLIMAEFNGRPLHKNEIVKHRDGDTLNNKIENLVKIIRRKK